MNVLHPFDINDFAILVDVMQFVDSLVEIVLEKFALSI